MAPSGGEGTYLRRLLFRVAAAAGSVLRTWPLYGSMHTARAAAISHRRDADRHGLHIRYYRANDRANVKADILLIKNIYIWHAATTRQCSAAQRRPWRQMMTAYKITDTHPNS